MSGRRNSFCILGVLLAPLVLASCDLTTEGRTVFVDTPVDILVLQGSQGSDTIQASLPVRVALSPEDDEVPRPLRLSVAFNVTGEECGEAQAGLVTSDDRDEAATTWVLGRTAQECVMEVRALAPSGTILGLTTFEATIEPGRPVEGWLAPGVVERGVDSLFLEVESHPLQDRFNNFLPWRFRVVNGPAVALGAEFDDPRSRTLLATGEGSGEVELRTRFGVFFQAAFNVCTTQDQRWIRVFRPDDANTVLAACP